MTDFLEFFYQMVLKKDILLTKLFLLLSFFICFVLQGGENYVCSSVSNFKKLDYVALGKF